MKKGAIKKMLFYGAAAFVVAIGMALALVYTYQDKIIELFITEANKHIRTKVDVQQISLSLFEKFPQVAVSLDQVNVHEGLPESTESLARANKLYFTFSLWDVVRGRYNVKQFYMEQGEVYVKVLPDGTVNYQVITTDTASAEDGEFSFDLEQINLSEVDIHYIDQQLEQRYEVNAHKLAAALAISPETIDIEAEGQATINTIKVGTGEYFKGKRVQLASALSINRQEQNITLQPSVVQVEKAAYEVGGTIAYAQDTELDLQVNGKNTDIQSLLSLLPQHMTQEFSQYRSEGEIYFSGTVKGKASGKHMPQVSLSFGARNASFFHPDVEQRVEKINLKGSFTNGAKHNAATSVLELRELSGVLNGRTFKGNLTYKNFDNPYIAFDVQGMLDVAYVLGLAKLDQVRSGSGLADVRIAFSGNLNEFKARPGISSLNSTGDFTLHNVSLAVKELRLPLSNLNGNFMFK
ncbi:MAG: hypothetical protein LPK03_07240, partial [Pontibacter sp.]|nr:hypothetical protein [Pontibacter sp.]